LRNIKFELGGKTVVFNQPEDATVAIKEVRHSQLRTIGA
jgi:F-box and WD-40 domain protein CDC4